MANNLTAETLKTLKKLLGRWFTPTMARHKLHVKTCERLHCEDLIEPFNVFATEVLNAPEAVRDDMLGIQPLEPYEPFMKYEAYVTPVDTKLELYGVEMGRKLR